MRLRLLTRTGLAALAAGLLTLSCDSSDVVTNPDPDPDPDPDPTLPTTASGWVDAVDWDQRTVVEVDMVEDGASLSFSPNVLTFEAGQPYVLRINNPAANAGKHYFSPEGTSFFQAIATRKIQTAEAEYKAPYFDAVELKIGGSLEIFFVPVLGGIYDIICTIAGHKEAGMTATATVSGGEGYQLDLEVAADFNTDLTTDPRKSGSHEVWSTAVETTISMQETQSSFGFVPPDIDLSRDVGYKLTLDNPTGNASKHYYTAAEFYKTVVLRKADDSQAEIKAPYLKAVELLLEGTTTLFMVPTADGVFEVLCTIPGHADLGMTGTITVGEPPPDLQPTLNSIQANIFTPFCTQCHTGAVGPLGLALDEGVAYGNLVGVASVQIPALLHVNPGKPDSSYVMWKIEGRPGIVGQPMPPALPPLSAEQIQAVRGWIEAGAQDN